MSLVYSIQSPEAPATHEAAELGQIQNEELLFQQNSQSRRNARTKNNQKSWWFAFSMALFIHAALISLAFYAVKKFAIQPNPPQLILPKGWATEFEGTANASAAASFQNLQPITITPLSSIAPQPVADPPFAYEPPAITAPAVLIDPSNGTDSTDQLPSFSSNPKPPANHRTPPVGNMDGGGTSSDAPPAASGSAQTGAGDGSGGGTQGVPEGMPVPSIHNKIPIYPAEALRNGWTGMVKLELTINANGQVSSAKVIAPSKYRVLDLSALEFARDWRFTPAQLHGQPVPFTVIYPVDFQQPERTPR